MINILFGMRSAIAAEKRMYNMVAAIERSERMRGKRFKCGPWQWVCA